MLVQIINTIGITPVQLKVFLFSVAAVLTMIILQHFGIRSPIHIF